ncbi:methyltransferase domain-containing protein [Belnapia sp. T6]|uniref:Methyltransferase domain-containing protein n=1 Tax=Belnapia mucosa TaxID=2804532 RepID=A0ABS1V8C6_9PROT|nr:methyltransferase domain-containing protein [Belnapia mucosa]MBL6457597.1 methyltransferase domain-containing protein [Belnapia mucosa]
MPDPEPCTVCGKGALQPLREIDGIGYLRCTACGSILAERGFLERSMAGEARIYDEDYWAEELKAARERGHGASLIRLAEVFYYARRPVRRFLDVSCGAGTLLDSATELLPEIADTFWGIEPFPPPAEYRARHPNYRIGFLRDLDGTFDGGTCIEVIEHLAPPVLRGMLAELAAVSAPDALWYFNSAQPDFVLRDDPGYLDPYKRGHIASYSVEGLRPVFAEAGFTLHALPGRDWAFLAEYARRPPPEDKAALFHRLWTMLPENRALLDSARFGHLLLAAGLEGARCYIEAEVASWAVGELRHCEAGQHNQQERRRQAETQLAAVLSSTSWRMTMPLRHAVRFGKSLLHRS